MGNNLDTRLNVRLRRDELETIRARAELNGLNISDYIRYLVENEIKGANVNKVCSVGNQE